MSKVLGSFWLWLAAAVVVTVSVFVISPTTSLEQRRITHLESLVRCPACEDLSVAQSNAPSSIAVRHQIAAAVRAGASDTAILTSLEHQYGTAILLSPDAGGLGYLLWIIPFVVIGGGFVIYGRLVRRRS